MKASTSRSLRRVSRPTFTQGSRLWKIHLRMAASLTASVLAASLVVKSWSNVTHLLSGLALYAVLPYNVQCPETPRPSSPRQVVMVARSAGQRPYWLSWKPFLSPGHSSFARSSLPLGGVLVAPRTSW